ncbi:MAG: carbohydrate ABC transporter permease [Phycisphaeraceae bacterium]|nr:MAG: carbohydrate ABC transporter permease [Phycisphaeraceae bacterium]
MSREHRRRAANTFNRPPFAVRLASHIVVYTVAATMLIPFLWMVLTSLKTSGEANTPPSLSNLLPATPQWSNYATAWNVGGHVSLLDFYINSFMVAAITTVLAVAHNALAGFAFSKMRFRGKAPLFWATLLTMMLPAQVFFIFAYVLCSWIGYIDNIQALVVPFLASGFGVFYMRQAVTAVPDDLIDAGRVDGMHSFDIFWTIVRPIVWPGITALAIFTFMNSWNSFFWPLLVVDSMKMKTLPLAVADLASAAYFTDYPTTMAAATLLVLPLVILFFFMQRAFTQGIAMTGLKE